MAGQIIQAGRMLIDVLPTGATPGSLGSGLFTYVGNTPEFALSRSVETVTHYDSDGAGLKQKDISIDIQNDYTGSVQTDNVSVANLGLWLGSAAAPLAVTAGTGVTQSVVAKKGGIIVLGVSGANFGGVGPVTAVSMTRAGSPVLAPGNWALDAARGTIYIIPTGAIADGDALIVTYSNAARSVNRAQALAETLYARLRFEGASRGGDAIPKNFYCPYCKITASGDLAMKGDTWMSMSFALEPLASVVGAPPFEISDGSATSFVWQ
jgi:hypothetical protein